MLDKIMIQNRSGSHHKKTILISVLLFIILLSFLTTAQDGINQQDFTKSLLDKTNEQKEFPMDMKSSNNTILYTINETNIHKAFHTGDGYTPGELYDYGENTPLYPFHDQYQEHDSDEYVNVEADDEQKNAWVSYDFHDEDLPNNNYINLWYHFKIQEAVRSIIGLQVLWNGHDTLSELGDFEFDIWNYSSNQWEYLNQTFIPRSTDTNYVKTFTHHLSNYISTNGSLHLGISGEKTENTRSRGVIVYAKDQEAFHPDFSLGDDHIHAQLESIEYAVLPHLQKEDNILNFSLWSRDNKQFFLNHLALIKVVHDVSTEIIYDQHSNTTYAIKEKQYPSTVISSTGESVVSQLSQHDDDRYWMTTDTLLERKDIGDTDYIDLTFPLEQNQPSQNIKLVIRAKQTGFINEIVRSMITAIEGPECEYQRLHNDTDLAQQFINWMTNTTFLHIFEKTNETVQIIESLSFHNSGCYHTFVIPINISADQDLLQLRLSGLPGAFQIDEVFIDTTDTSSTIVISEIPVHIINASMTTNKEAHRLLSRIDDQYLLINHNDVIKFQAVDAQKLSEYKQATYVLCSSSYAELPSFSQESDHTVTTKNNTLVTTLFDHPKRTANTFLDSFLNRPMMLSPLPSSQHIPHNTLYEDNVQVKVTTGAIGDPSWYSYHWRNRKLISLDSSQITATLTQMPIVIRLKNDTDLKDTLQDHAEDILFIDYQDNMTKFAHEIESYDGKENITVWVNVSTISSTTDTKFWMYYNNPTCTDQQNISSTWSAQFRMVHHLQETNGTHYDSTINDHHGNCAGGVNQSVQGLLNGADSFDGIDDTVTVGAVNTSSNWTISFWAKSFDITDTVYYPIGLSTLTPLASGIGLGGQWPNINNDFYVYDGNTVIHGGPQVVPGKWYFVTVVKTDQNFGLYVNGTMQNSGALNDISISDLRFGSRSDDSWYFNGVIDEITVHTTALDQHRIHAMYQNQKENATFLSIGSEEVINLLPTADFIYHPDHPFTQQTVYFNSTSYDTDGTIVNWTWNIENLSYYGEHIEHQFSINDVFNITLIIQDDNNATDEISYLVPVLNQPPIANFTFTPLEPAINEMVFFNSTSIDHDGVIVNVSWDFGDGNYSYVENATHQYAHNGSYYVNLTATDDDNDSTTIQKGVYIGNEHPFANFSFDPLLPLKQEQITFNSSSYDIDGFIVNWSWSFGDGNISYGELVTHQYAHNGSYVVRLTVTDDDNASDYTERIVQVGNQLPIVNFTFDPLLPLANELVTFNSSSYDIDGVIVNWSWSFGDGNISYGELVTHQYAHNGSYVVRLTVTDDDNETSFLEQSIAVGNLLPIVEFSVEPADPISNQTVYFNSTSYDLDGFIVNWSWSFGDGNIAYGEQVTHQFLHNGSYPVSLTVKDDAFETNTDDQSVTIGNQKPLANFTFSPLYPVVLEPISFNSTSIDTDGSIVNWTWSFGDGSYSYGENTSHYYTTNGSYTASLMITDDDNATSMIDRVVPVGNQQPVTNFSIQPLFPRVFETVYFNSTSYDVGGMIVNWTWSFGDGNRSYTENVTYQYSNKGDYLVSLTVTDDQGLNDTLSKQLRIGGFEISTISPGWNFISLPFNYSLSKTNLTIVYNDTEWSWTNATTGVLVSDYIFGWDRTNNQYIFSDTLDPGYGYWLYSFVNASIISAKGSIIIDSYITDVESGWNVIGLPLSEDVHKHFINISFNNTLYTWNEAVTASLISDYIFGWNGDLNSYQFSDWFISGSCYWVYSYQESRFLQFIY